MEIQRIQHIGFTYTICSVQSNNIHISVELYMLMILVKIELEISYFQNIPAE
jgi:hypothetical protein